jgi:hypothetical protein
MMKIWLAIPILLAVLLSASPSSADAPRVMRHWHDASGHLVWRYTHDWQIVRSFRDRRNEGRYTYQVYHQNQLIGTTSSLPAAKRAITEATR